MFILVLKQDGLLPVVTQSFLEDQFFFEADH